MTHVVDFGSLYLDLGPYKIDDIFSIKKAGDLYSFIGYNLANKKMVIGNINKSGLLPNKEINFPHTILYAFIKDDMIQTIARQGSTIYMYHISGLLK